MSILTDKNNGHKGIRSVIIIKYVTCKSLGTFQPVSMLSKSYVNTSVQELFRLFWLFRILHVDMRNSVTVPEKSIYFQVVLKQSNFINDDLKNQQ